MELSRDVDKRGEKGSYLRVLNCIISVTLISTEAVSVFSASLNFFRMRLKRQFRMNSRTEFLRVRNEGKSYAGKYLVLGLLEDDRVEADFKFGIIVSQKDRALAAFSHPWEFWGPHLCLLCMLGSPIGWLAYIPSGVRT